MVGFLAGYGHQARSQSLPSCPEIKVRVGDNGRRTGRQSRVSWQAIAVEVGHCRGLGRTLTPSWCQVDPYRVGGYRPLPPTLPTIVMPEGGSVLGAIVSKAERPFLQPH
jgi:hypothetical protein